MEKIIFTQLSVPEIQEIIRVELRTVLKESNGSHPESLPDILNVEQTARFLNRSIDAIYKLTAKKLIPHYNPSGKLLLFKRVDLMKWMETGKIKTISEMKIEVNKQLKNQKRR